MKKPIFLLFMQLLFLSLNAQTFNFESTTVPSGWAAGKGTVTVSSEHCKEGGKSLKWKTSGTSVLNVTFTGFTADATNSSFFNIYSKLQSNDTLKVEFLYNSTVKRTATFLCNYSGWREFNRAYTEYASIPYPPY